MSVPKLLARYVSVAAAWNLPTLDCKKIDVSTEDVSWNQRDSLWHRLAEFAPREGWVAFQSKVVAFDRSRLPEPDGVVLQAEIVAAGDASLHVAWMNPETGWRLTFLREQDGNDVLAESVTYLGDADAPGALTYRRYWRIAGDTRPFCARFAGFKGLAQ